MNSHEFYDLDSVNFALGIAHFDPRVHQPHPPGYFLYICCGRLLTHFIHDPNLALVLLSIAASCGTVVFIYLLALKWFGQLAARFAALLFLLSPLAWFHGMVALTYGIEAFFSALVGYLCWLVFRGSYRWIPATGLVLGNIRRGEAVFPAPPRTAFSARPVQGAHQVQGERSHCSGARGRSMVCSHAACKRARLLPEMGLDFGR